MFESINREVNGGTGPKFDESRDLRHLAVLRLAGCGGRAFVLRDRHGFEITFQESSDDVFFGIVRG